MIFDENNLKSCIKNIIDGFCNEYQVENIRKEPPQVWDAVLQEVGQKLFKTDIPQKHNRKSLIEYDNKDQLEMIYNLFVFFSRIYNKEITIDKFSLFTGINRDTLYTWLNSEYRSYIYINNIDNTVIKDIDTYLLINNNNWQNVTKVLTSWHSDFVKRIKKDNENSLNNINIGDRNNVGASMKLNTVFGYNGMYGHENSERKQLRLEKNNIKTGIESGLNSNICLPDTDKNADQ